MVMEKIMVCPKCGSREIEIHQRGSRGDYKECRSCGHVGDFIEELVDESSGKELWP